MTTPEDTELREQLNEIREVLQNLMSDAITNSRADDPPQSRVWLLDNAHQDILEIMQSATKRTEKEIMKGKAQHTCFNQFINSKGNKVCACGSQVMPDGSILIDQTICNICKKLMKRGHTKCIPKN